MRRRNTGAVEQYFGKDYIRFRDNTEFGVVTDCTFRSTGRYTQCPFPFHQRPLFNDDDPAGNPAWPNYEYFGTHVPICHNTFISSSEARPEARIAVFTRTVFLPPAGTTS